MASLQGGHSKFGPSQKDTQPSGPPPTFGPHSDAVLGEPIHSLTLPDQTHTIAPTRALSAIARDLLTNLRANGGSTFNALKTILKEIENHPLSEDNMKILKALAKGFKSAFVSAFLGLFASNIFAGRSMRASFVRPLFLMNAFREFFGGLALLLSLAHYRNDERRASNEQRIADSHKGHDEVTALSVGQTPQGTPIPTAPPFESMEEYLRHSQPLYPSPTGPQVTFSHPELLEIAAPPAHDSPLPTVRSLTLPDQIPTLSTIARDLLANLRANGGSAFNILKTILQGIQNTPISEEKKMVLKSLAGGFGFELAVDIFTSSQAKGPFAETLFIKTKLPLFLKLTSLASVTLYILIKSYNELITKPAAKYAEGAAIRNKEAAERQAKIQAEYAEKIATIDRREAERLAKYAEGVATRIREDAERQAKIDKKYVEDSATINRNAAERLFTTNRGLLRTISADNSIAARIRAKGLNTELDLIIKRLAALETRTASNSKSDTIDAEQYELNSDLGYLIGYFEGTKRINTTTSEEITAKFTTLFETMRPLANIRLELITQLRDLLIA